MLLSPVDCTGAWQDSRVLFLTRPSEAISRALQLTAGGQWIDLMDSSRSSPIAVARSNGRPGRGTLRNAWPQQRASVARARQPSRVGRINSHYDPNPSPKPKFCTKRALRARLACRCSAATLRVRGPGRPASRRSRPLLAARFDSGCATHILRRAATRGTRQAGCGGAGRSQASMKCRAKFLPIARA